MIPPKFEYIYSITYFRKSITYQHSIKTEPKFKINSKRWINVDVTIKLPFEIDILSTGKSDFILIECENKFIVIDCGLYENNTLIKDYLNYKGVNEIEYLILTHNDKDHIGSAPMILDNFKIKNLIQANYKKYYPI